MIYLDNAATTACDPAVVEEMLPYFTARFANASSVDHVPGNTAKQAVDQARERIAALVGSQPEDVIFTAGSTEANNIVLTADRAVVTSTIEHPSILDALANRNNPDDCIIAVDADGHLKTGDLTKAIEGMEPRLVSIIATNNETGTEQDLGVIATIATAAQSLVHLDATQALVSRGIDMKALGVAGLSISAHKIYGPKGVGALIAASALRRLIKPVLRGGGHERGLRSGTLNVPGIVGFGKAAELALRDGQLRRERLTDLKQNFLQILRECLGDRLILNVAGKAVSPHILSLRISGVNGRALLRSLRDSVAFSLGSACATNKAEPSYVLMALGLDKKTISETFRVSFSATQPVEEVRRAASLIGAAAIDLSRYSANP